MYARPRLPIPLKRNKLFVLSLLFCLSVQGWSLQTSFLFFASHFFVFFLFALLCIVLVVCVE